jgi:Mce-associated membrane protein
MTSLTTAHITGGPSWYDVLGVEPTSSEADVRIAWKQAIAELEPSDRRFRLLNQAAEVLLEHDRRAAYDAELLSAELDASHRLHEETSGEPEATATVVPGGIVPGGIVPGWIVPGWIVPGWLLVTVAAIAALVVGACSVLAATAPSDASIADATRAAQASAERAIVPILSYDGSQAGDLDADQRAAEAYLTDDYRAEYAKLFEVIKANAPTTRTKVTAEVIASGIVRSGENRVSVLVFVNRPTTNKQLKDPVVYKDQVTVTMQKVGDQWLVDDLVTSPAGG